MEYTFQREPCGPSYRTLIEYAVGCCGSMTLVTRHSVSLSSGEECVLGALSPFLLTKMETDHWPGTQLIGHTACLHRFTYGESQASILLQVADSLFSWLQPEMPEDLCLYRPDGSLWLTTISHERDAFLCLTPAEADELKEATPDLFDLLVSS